MNKIYLIILSLVLCQIVYAQDLIPITFDKAPQFPGGNEKLLKSIQDSMIYPIESLKSKIGGTVYITFIIDTTGKPKDIKILKAVQADLDSEAVRIVRALPLWIPAECKGIKVSLPLTIPVTFNPSKSPHL